MKDYFFLGTINKLHGYKGELLAYLDTDEPQKYAELESVFIDNDGELIPYIIENLRFKDENNIILKLSGVDADEAKYLVKYSMYLPLSMLPPLTGNNFYYHEVVGFEVIDNQRGNIGKCTGFLETGKQAVMQIDLNGTEILLPAVDDFFESVDRENKILKISAPEGLIDLYLSNNEEDNSDQ